MTKKILHENGQCGMKLGTFGYQELVLVKSERYIRRRYCDFKIGTQNQSKIGKMPADQFGIT